MKMPEATKYSVTGRRRVVMGKGWSQTSPKRFSLPLRTCCSLKRFRDLIRFISRELGKTLGESIKWRFDNKS